MTRKLKNTEYINRVYDLVGKEYSILEKYLDTRTKLLTRHNFCGFEWNISPNKFLMGRRCPKCQRKNVADNQRKTLENLIKEISEIKNKEFSFVRGEYVNFFIMSREWGQECRAQEIRTIF